MKTDWYESILTNRTPMNPLPTTVTPVLRKLSDIRSVVFDIYGTLIISGSGDVGSADSQDDGARIASALQEAEIDPGTGRIPSIEDLHNQIRQCNSQGQSSECPKPEVDIVDIWRRTLLGCGITAATTQQINRLAAQYESTANPTWPMPGASQLLRTLSEKQLKLGIVSNAQEFTLRLIENLNGGFGVDSVFDMNLCVFSCRYRQAKPGPRLFDVLCCELTRQGISPSQTIYVGNDRLNDVWAASQAGLRTAWFAGDHRSLRARTEDPRVSNLEQDIVLTHLDQLVECL